MQLCKIKTIKKIKVPLQSVYDITTEKNHNFILKNNIIVHNCDFGQMLSSKGYPYSVLSVDRVGPEKICKPYQYFRTAIYEKRLEMYDDKILFQEITDLERNIDSGKVDHPDGGKKDVCDATCGSIFNASTHAEEFAFDYGESYDLLLNVNEEDAYNDAQQLALAMEEELKNMNPLKGLKNLHPSDATELTKRSDYNLYSDIIIL